MGKWWAFQSKAKKASQEMLFAREEVVRNQPASELQSFIDFAKRTSSTYRLSVNVEVMEAGKLMIEFQFNEEKLYKCHVPSLVQQHPEKLIRTLYKHEPLNDVNDELLHTKELLAKVECADVKMEHFRTNLTEYSAEERRVINLTEKKISDRHAVLSASMEKMWFNSPYLAERIHYVYRAFLLEQASRPSDSVEADLVALLDDEELSVETKGKARDLLAQYKALKKEEALDKVRGREEEALIILSTVEKHYVKKERSVDYG